jgi:4-alpha-glucanotransferase
MWWKNFPDEARKFSAFKHWKYDTKLSFEELLALLKDAHHTPSYFHINLLQEYLSLFPELIWEGGEKERINIPGTLLTSNWTYRFRPFLEEMVNHKGLEDAIENILQ